MKTKTIWCLAIILCSFFPIYVHATDYFVDFVGGDDTRAGTSEGTAWKHGPGDTNAAGNAQSVTLQPGDRVLFKGGVTYRGSIKIPDSGMTESPITYKGDGWGTGKAILDGSEILTGWTPCASAVECGGNPNWANIYYTYVSAELDVTAFSANLHENNEFLWLAQEPDLPDPFYRDQIAYFYTLPTGAMQVTSLTDPVNLNQADPDYWDNSFVMLWHIPNITTTREILSFNPNTHTITYEDVGGGGVYTDRETFYSIINSIHALDQAGEYYFHPVALEDGTHKVYLWPRNTGHLAQGIEISARNYGVDIAVNSHITVEGFQVQKFSGGSLTDCGIGSVTRSWDDKIKYVLIRNNYIRHDAHTELGYGGVFLSSCDDCMVENNMIEENVLTTGLFITNADHAVARGNTILRPGHTGMWYFGNTNSQIVNNTVTDVLGTHGNGITIYLSCNNILVAWNKLFNAGTGFTLQDSTNLWFYRNFVDADNRGGNVNEWGGSAPVSDGTIYFLNNTLVNSPKHASLNLGNTTGASYIVKNNILDGGGTEERSYNLYIGLTWDQHVRYGWAPGEGEIVGWDGSDYTPIALEAVFSDPDNRDYHLKMKSLAKGSGTDIRSLLPFAFFPDVDFDKDLDGNDVPVNGAYDIGVYKAKQSPVSALLWLLLFE